MGSDILLFFRNKIDPKWKLSFLSAFFIGLLVHFYKFVNLLPNHDSVFNFYSTQNMLASGRWFLGIACGISSFFDIPWVIGLVSLVFMGITAAIIGEIFHMENPVLNVLCSGLLVTFPAITATMFYEYTADGYMLAMALAAFSVYLTRMDTIGKQHWKRYVLSGICICLSCGIYQAYVSFSFVLAVCYFMTELLENRREEKAYWKWIGIQVLIYITALASYYVIWKICMHAAGIAASSYLGIDKAGTMNLSQLVQAVFSIIKSFIQFFLEWNILKHGVTVYSVLNICFLLAFAFGLIQAVFLSGCIKNRVHVLLLVLCVVAIPFGCYVLRLTSSALTYRTVMLQPISLLYIFVAVIFDRWLSSGKRKTQASLALLLLTAIVFNNSVAANLSYIYMEKCYEKTYASAVEISTRVHLMDDGTIRRVAFCGKLDSWSAEDFFDHGKLRRLGGWKHMDKSIMTPQFLSLYTDFDLSYYRSNGIAHPVVENEKNLPVPYDWEFRYPVLSAEDALELARTEQVRNMPVWPAKDSVKVFGDTVVVKLGEYEEPEES